ncbi:MAG TPA: BTAD domain-containing putative transcriptional regulator [Solirubrobacteraceae bacterium]|jgi:DNA-binding SARP family transcriptional activator
MTATEALSRPDPMTATPDISHQPSELAEEILDQIPYGVVVLDRRKVTSTNAAAVRLLWNVDRGGPPAECSELFECQAKGGPCEHGCLAERAAEGDAALPEIRIDAKPGATTTALWVTASPFSEERTLFHMRPGDARDRRRRSEPHWLSGPQLRISAFGRTWVDSPETPLGGQWLHQRPGLLLKYLVTQRNRVVHAEEIAEALWPGAGRQSINNVRHFMHALRSKLEPNRGKGAESSFISTVQGGYALNRRTVRIDADEFERLVKDGLKGVTHGDDGNALGRLEEALVLYRADLFEDEPYAEWAYDERDRLRGLAAQALREVVRMRLSRRELAAACGALERLAELEPYDVDTYKALLAVLVAQGRRTEAARRYAAYKARMSREFGEDPGFTLSDARLEGL